MNYKLNWMKRGRMNGVVSGVPVRFEPGFAFDIKVKKSHGKSHVSELEPPLVPTLFDLQTRAPLSLLRKGHSMTPATLHVRMLDQRRLEAIFKTTRKKRY